MGDWPNQLTAVSLFSCSSWRRWLDCSASSCSAPSGRWAALTGEDQSCGWRAEISSSSHFLSFSSPSESGSDFAWRTACHYHHSDTQKGKTKSWRVVWGWRRGLQWEEADKVLSSCSPSGSAVWLDIPPMGAWSCLPLTHSHSAIIPESRRVDADIHIS